MAELRDGFDLLHSNLNCWISLSLTNFANLCIWSHGVYRSFGRGRFALISPIYLFKVECPSMLS